MVRESQILKDDIVPQFSLKILPHLASPPRVVVSGHEVAELLRLYGELPVASMRAAEALRKSGGNPLKGIALRRFLDEHAEVTEIIRRIKVILGSS
jgi:hypothetical protein